MWRVLFKALDNVDSSLWTFKSRSFHAVLLPRTLDDTQLRELQWLSLHRGMEPMAIEHAPIHISDKSANLVNISLSNDAPVSRGWGQPRTRGRPLGRSMFACVLVAMSSSDKRKMLRMVASKPAFLMTAEMNLVAANTLDWNIASIPLCGLPFLTRFQPPWTTRREPTVQDDYWANHL